MVRKGGKTGNVIQTISILFLSMSMVFFLVLVCPVYAHRVYLFAWVEGDTVYTESYFGSKKKAIGGLISVFDPSGKKLLEGKTNEKGEFSFKIPQRNDLRIVLDATMGHRAEYILKADELTAIPAKADEFHKAEGIKVSPASPSNAKQVAVEQVREVVEEVLDSRLKPISKALAKLREEKGPGFTEVVGGIGYILGIMGIIVYFKSRKKN